MSLIQPTLSFSRTIFYISVGSSKSFSIIGSYIQKNEEFYGLIFDAFARNNQSRLLVDAYLSILDYSKIRLSPARITAVLAANLLNFKEPFVHNHVLVFVTI